MSKFYEEVLTEYPKIEKKKNWKRDVSIRFRVVKRLIDGIERTLFDIREYIVNNDGAYFTDSAITLTRDDMEKLISYLLDAKKEYFNGTAGIRSKDTSNTQTKV